MSKLEKKRISKKLIIVSGFLILISTIGFSYVIWNFNNQIYQIDQNISDVNNNLMDKEFNLQQFSFTTTIATNAADTLKILKLLNTSSSTPEASDYIKKIETKIKSYMKLAIRTMDPKYLNLENELENKSIQELADITVVSSKNFTADYNDKLAELNKLYVQKNKLVGDRNFWYVLFVVLNSIGLFLGILSEYLKNKK